MVRGVSKLPNSDTDMSWDLLNFSKLRFAEYNYDATEPL